MPVSASGSQTNSDTSGWMNSLFAFWRREFGRTEPTRVSDLVVFPLAVSAIAGLITGIVFAAHRHFLDPAFIAVSYTHLLPNVAIEAESPRDINVTLKPGGSTESVTVTADQEQQLQTADASIGSTITSCLLYTSRCV